MSEPEHRVEKADPDLIRQLDVARGTDQPVEAVVWLERRDGASTLSPDEVEGAAQAVIDRVAEKVGSKPTGLNVLRNLGILVVVAAEPFVRNLIEQPEVRSVVANSPEHLHLNAAVDGFYPEGLT